MRNLKKVLAVILTVALLASMMMVPALAAVSNEAEAKALKAIGLFKGYGDDLGLTDKLTREQGMILVIRAMGAEEAALAMTDAEVDAALADVTDLNTIGTWAGARNYAAYALKAGLTKGISAASLVYGGQLDFAGDQLVILLLRAMGYSQAEKDNCWDLAVKAGFVSAGGAVALQLNNALIRDDAAGVLHSAVKNGVCADGKTLIEKLIASGAVDEDAAAGAGFIAAKPDVLEVESVEATNLKEVVVTFNKEVNEDTVDTRDFDIDGETIESVSVDGNVVTLTIAGNLDNDEDYTLEVEEIEDLDENVIEDTEIDFTANDVELPRLLDVEFTGPQTVKLTFSEPIKSTNDGEVSVDDGIYNASNFVFDGNEVEVDLGTELDEGEHEFKVKGFEDYVPYKMISKTIDVEYVDIDEAPEITVKEASQTKVTLKFSRPVKGLVKEAFYHTYSSWKALDIKNGATAIDNEEEYYDEVTLYFANVKDEKDIPLPEGKVKIVVLAEANDVEIEDRWGNNLDDDVVLYTNISADNTAPTVKKVKIESQTEARFYLSEECKVGKVSADEIEIIDEDGDKVKTYDYTRKVVHDEDKDEYYLEILFDDEQEGEFKITILGGIYDLSLTENEIKKVTMSFNMTDTTGVDLDKADVNYVSKKILYVDYGTAMATSGSSSVLNWDNYQLIGTDNKAVKIEKSNVKLSMFTNKIVKIVFDKDQTFVKVDDEGKVTARAKLRIGRVADVKGNLAEDLFAEITIYEEAGPLITAVKKTAENKFELTVNKELKSVDRRGIKIDADLDGTPTQVASVSFVNDDDDTIIKVTTVSTGEDKDTNDGTEFALVKGANKFTVSIVKGDDDGYIKSITGTGMASKSYAYGDAGVKFEDGMAPKLVKLGDKLYDDPDKTYKDSEGNNYKGEYIVYAQATTGTTVDTIYIQYSEAIDQNSLSKFTYKVGGYTVGKAEAKTIDGKYYVVLEVSNDDKDEKDDREDELTLIQVYAVEDADDNSYLEEDAIDIIPAQTWIDINS